MKISLKIIIITGFFFTSRLWSGIPAAFVDVGYGARPVGTGGAYVALANDAHSVLWNPAGLLRMTKRQATFMYSRQFQLVPFYFASFGTPFRSSCGAGLAFISTGDDVLRETTVLTSFAFSGQSFLRRSFSKLGLGCNLKIRNSTFGNNADGGENRSQGDAWGVGLDFGMQFSFSKRLIFGMLLRDPVSPVFYHNTTTQEKYTESIPPALVSGLAFIPLNRLIVVSDFEAALSKEAFNKIRFGFEYHPILPIYLRGGFSQNIAAEENRQYALGIGFCMKYRNQCAILLDLAYQFHFLQDTPRASMSVWF